MIDEIQDEERIVCAVMHTDFSNTHEPVLPVNNCSSLREERVCCANALTFG